MAELKVPVVNENDQQEVELPTLSPYDKPEKISSPKVSSPGPDDTYLLEGDVRVSGDLQVDGIFILKGLPTTDPGRWGALWYDENSSTLMVSLG